MPRNEVPMGELVKLDFMLPLGRVGQLAVQLLIMRQAKEEKRSIVH